MGLQGQGFFSDIFNKSRLVSPVRARARAPIALIGPHSWTSPRARPAFSALTREGGGQGTSQPGTIEQTETRVFRSSCCHLPSAVNEPNDSRERKIYRTEPGRHDPIYLCISVCFSIGQRIEWSLIEWRPSIGPFKDLSKTAFNPFLDGFIGCYHVDSVWCTIVFQVVNPSDRAREKNISVTRFY